MFKTWLKWWLIFTSIIIGGVAAYYIGDHDAVIEFAMSSGVIGVGICSVISFILTWKTLFCGYLAFYTGQARKDANNPIIKEVGLFSLLDSLTSYKKSMTSGWFWAEQCMSLGMAGTIIGFMMSLTGFSAVDITNQTAIKEMIGVMGAGLSTALFTTIFGLIASILLKIQYFIVEQDVNRDIEYVREKLS